MKNLITIAAQATSAQVAADLQQIIDTPPTDACPTAMLQLRREVGSMGVAARHRADVGNMLQQVWADHQALMLSGFVFDHPEGAFEVDHLIINKLGAITIYVSAFLEQGKDVSMSKEGVWEIREDADVQRIPSPIERARVLRDKLSWVLQNRLVGQLPYPIDRNTVTFAVVIPDRASFISAERRPPVLRVCELGTEKRLREIRSNQFHHASGSFDPSNSQEVHAMHRHIQMFARHALGRAQDFAEQLAQAKLALEAVAASPTPEYYLRKTGVVTGHVERISGHDVALLPMRSARQSQDVQHEGRAVAV